jgi:DNA repair protein RadC
VNGRDAFEALSAFLGSRRRAKSLLARTTLRHLAASDESELARFMPRADAARFSAALRLAREAIAPAPRMRLDTPTDAYAHLYRHLVGREAERFAAVICDVRTQVLAVCVIAEGTPGFVDMHPSDVFAPAIRHRGAGIVVAHNHPSGVPTPSQSDLDLTDRLRAAGRVLGIPVLDHLIVAGDRFWSVEEGRETRVEIAECTRPRR